MHVSVVRRIDCVDPYYDFHHGLLRVQTTRLAMVARANPASATGTGRCQIGS